MRDPAAKTYETSERATQKRSEPSVRGQDRTLNAVTGASGVRRKAGTTHPVFQLRIRAGVFGRRVRRLANESKVQNRTAPRVYRPVRQTTRKPDRPRPLARTRKWERNVKTPRCLYLLPIKQQPAVEFVLPARFRFKLLVRTSWVCTS